MALSPLNPWRPSGAGESQTLWCASGSPRGIPVIPPSPSLLRSFRRSWLAMRSRVRSLRSPLRALDRASHRASLALRGWLRGGMTVRVVHKQECRACETPCLCKPRIPDVLTAGIRDNGNLARVYSAGNRGVGESGVWFLFPLLRQRHRVIVHLLCSLC